MPIDFYKYHGLGNDYLVIEPTQFESLQAFQVSELCHRHRGIGADGVLFGPHWPKGHQQPPTLDIYNPDGSLAEKSGNGLRIFAYHLWRREWIKQRTFVIGISAELVKAELLSPDGSSVAIEMGQAIFELSQVPMYPPVTSQTTVWGPHYLQLEKESVEVFVMGLGNPHCVVFFSKVDKSLACRIGPQLERHPCFPQRTNVQLVQVLDDHQLRVEVWERGAGYTLASGSSACAASVAAVRLGHVRSPLKVHMPGGFLQVDVSKDFNLRQQGPVRFVYEGVFSKDYKKSLQLR